MKNLDKVYNPKKIEEEIYSNWEKNRCFKATVNKNKIPFTIVMPPPNITGKLHMGHALDNALQDIIIRYKRMQGYNALWIPGTDHAAISTEVKVTEYLKSQGIDKKELGRESFLEKTWEWKKKYGSTITTQLRKLGSSCDWDREAFTMDDNLTDAVNEVFIRLYKKGYIYKGNKIVNWCPKCNTSISDAEVVHVEQPGFFWHIKYYYKDRDGYIEIATTRPETLLGDSAIAVNPLDGRYKDVIGENVILPLVNKSIPIIADEYVDMEFGTGAVKITPAHDPNDFEVGQRHNLEQINILNDDGTINENGGKYSGLDRYEARKQIVADLDNGGYLVEIKNHFHSVGTHDRCDTTVEPRVKSQWFVKMDELKKPAIDAIKNNELRFVPERFNKIYLHWLENIHDWCISRQLWWGHRIPVYYCEDCGEIIVSKEEVKKCPKCNKTNIHQDSDTLDTWFSSALWPFSTLGWPKNTEDLDYFYPTDVLVTGYDIIFFWVIRMVFSGYEQTGKSPFKTVFIHGLVRDSKGRKMSKSLGNGIDPLEIIDKYGADALRLALVSGISPGNDLRFSDEKILYSRNFNNKIWNAARFLLMNIDETYSFKDIDDINLEIEDKWILSRLNDLIINITNNLENFELGIAVDNLISFIWDEYCDWYIEMSKARFNFEENMSSHAAKWTAYNVFISLMKMLHPFMPFITDEIYRTMKKTEDSVMLSEFPKPSDKYCFKSESDEIELFKDYIRQIRNIRSRMKVPSSRYTTIYFVIDDKNKIARIEELANRYKKMLFSNKIIVKEKKDFETDNLTSLICEGATIYIPLDELIDKNEEIKRCEKEKNKLLLEIKRIDDLLNNENFISKAPEFKINEERKKLDNYSKMLNETEEMLSRLR